MGTRIPGGTESAILRPTCGPLVSFHCLIGAEPTFTRNFVFFFVVYVDDFKLAGLSGRLAEGWRLIREGIHTEKPEKLDLYLGCKHSISESTITGADGKPRARFQELSSCPASMEASKAADCYGLWEGHSVEAADAVQAYVQAKFEGTRGATRRSMAKGMEAAFY